jgi:hypothetical protein
MSTALASARRRRAGPEMVAPAPGNRQTIPKPSFAGQPAQQSSSLHPTSPNMTTGLTLPQVISVVDKRLIALESYVKDQQENTNNSTFSAGMGENNNQNSEEINAVFEEYNARFDIIADEIAGMKDLIMKLQSYTMEVNKTLMQDRIHILSDTNLSFTDQPESITHLEQALNAVGTQNH